jgi:hypothetical protein
MAPATTLSIHHDDDFAGLHVARLYFGLYLRWRLATTVLDQQTSVA